MTREHVTPKRAAELLAKNTANRPINKSHVQAIARAIMEGRWIPSDVPILVDTGGRLIDGQHRLAAVIRADKAIEVVVLEGVDPRLREVLDTGKPRSALDVTRLMGTRASNDEVAAYRYFRVMELSQQTGTWPSAERLGLDKQQTARLVAESIDDIREAVQRARRVEGRAVVRPASLAGGFLLLLRRLDNRTRAQDEFIDGFVTGTELDAGAPVLALRSAWMEANAAGHGRSGRTVAWRAAVMVYAWNAHVQRRSLRQVKWANISAFPKIDLFADGGAR